jgi:hypothetical protein
MLPCPASLHVPSSVHGRPHLTTTGQGEPAVVECCHAEADSRTSQQSCKTLCTTFCRFPEKGLLVVRQAGNLAAASYAPLLGIPFVIR